MSKNCHHQKFEFGLVLHYRQQRNVRRLLSNHANSPAITPFLPFVPTLNQMNHHKERRRRVPFVWWCFLRINRTLGSSHRPPTTASGFAPPFQNLVWMACRLTLTQLPLAPGFDLNWHDTICYYIDKVSTKEEQNAIHFLGGACSKTNRF